MSGITHPFFIFYIGHVIDPFLLYCLTTNAFFSIGVAVVWEIVEHAIYSVFGNYSPLFLEGLGLAREGSGIQEGITVSEEESLTDILIYDIGGAIVAVSYAHVLYKALRVQMTPRVRLSWETWTDLLPIALKALCLSPISALGWECFALVDNWCQSDGYMLFPWGMLVIVPVNTLFILHFFADAKERWWLVGTAWLLFLTAFQRVVPGAFVAICLFSFLTLLLWLYGLFRAKAEDYKRIDLAEV